MYLTKVPYWLQKMLDGLIWTWDKDRVHLTFDDGPHPDTTPWILDYLDEISVNATFFVVGEQVEKHPQLFESIKSRGHAIGNHGYRHVKAWNLSVEEFQENVNRGADISGSKLFRPPYGQIGWRQYQEIKYDHQVVMWSIMPGDFNKSLNVSKTIRRINNQLKGGDIIVLHDNPEHFEVMKAIIKGIKKI